MHHRNLAKSSKTIASDLESRIRAGELRPGEAIPPIRELGETYGVAPMTIRRALSALCAQGKLKTEPGVGVFVSDRCPLEGVVFLSSFHERRERPWWLGNPEPHMAGAKEACAELGIPLIAAADNDNPRQFLGRGYGFFVNFADLMAPEMAPWTAAIINARAPHVSAGFDHGMFNYISPDFGAAVSLALRHLRSLGHRHIAVVPRPRATGQPFFTHVGLPETAGLDISIHPIGHKTTDTPAAIQEITTDALKSALSHTPRPTALLVGNCGFVTFAMQGLHDLGVQVPLDVSVVGVCREVFGEWDGRRITRVDNPRRLVARRAVYELVKMASIPGYNPGRILVTPEFFDGDTCAPLDLAKTRQPALATV